MIRAVFAFYYWQQCRMGERLSMTQCSSYPDMLFISVFSNQVMNEISIPKYYIQYLFYLINALTVISSKKKEIIQVMLLTGSQYILQSIYHDTSLKHCFEYFVSIKCVALLFHRIFVDTKKSFFFSAYICLYVCIVVFD